VGKGTKKLRDTFSNVVNPILGLETPGERQTERALENQRTQFKRQAQRQEQQSRAEAMLKEIKKRRKSGTAVRRLGELGLAGLRSRDSNDNLG